MIERSVHQEAQSSPSAATMIQTETATTPVKRVQHERGDPVTGKSPQNRPISRPAAARASVVITKESLHQTISDALDMAYELLDEEDDYDRDLYMTTIVQGEPANAFWGPSTDGDEPPATKRRR